MFRFATVTILFVFSLTALCLQLSSIKGCDFIRIHFKALNDNGIYFNNNPYVGLGLLEHQTFTGKNTRDWQFDETCQPYNPLEANMFLTGNMISIKTLTVSSLALHGIAVLTLGIFLVSLVRGCFVAITDKQVTMPVFCILIGMMSSASLALQVIAIDKIHDDNGICDRDTYFPTGWNENFPFQTYPEYAYFKYFHECKMGPDGRRAKESIVISGFVTFFALISATVMLLRDSSTSAQVANSDNKFQKDMVHLFPLDATGKKNGKGAKEQGETRRTIRNDTGATVIMSSRSSSHEDDATDIDDDEASFFESTIPV